MGEDRAQRDVKSGAVRGLLGVALGMAFGYGYYRVVGCWNDT